MVSKRPSRKKPLKITKTNRARVDPDTGKIISRRQYDKRYSAKAIAHAIKTGSPKHKKYISGLKRFEHLGDDFIEKRNRDGRPLKTRYQALNSKEFQAIIRGLNSKNPKTKAKALEASGRITPDQVEFYSQKFSDEGEE